MASSVSHFVYPHEKTVMKGVWGAGMHNVVKFVRAGEVLFGLRWSLLEC